jgi:hypothetical protein
MRQRSNGNTPTLLAKILKPELGVVGWTVEVSAADLTPYWVQDCVVGVVFQYALV